MLRIDLKPLFSRLNSLCTMSLEHAAGLTLSKLHYEISIEHFLLSLLEQENSDLTHLFKQSEIDVERLRHLLLLQLDQLKSGNASRPVFSPLLTDWVQEAWLISSLQLNQEKIRSGALLLTLIKRSDYYLTRTDWGRCLTGLSSDVLQQRFFELVHDSVESPLGEQEGGSSALRQSDSALEKYCEDFCAKAREHKIDPVLGRDDEIRQLIDILGRRRKNNPICVGEPGVGKTAVVEGLAQRIVSNEVPSFLQNTRLIGLDLGLLEAGASVKGEFEKRLKAVIDEIQASTQPVILFIDEAHMLIGAGGNAGGTDAANLLKPALARGELRTIAATTWSEYKKYFERDPALARRFQVVKLEAPNVEMATQILRGLKSQYEKSHGVIVRDDAVVAAVELSDRYIIGRMLPDKAVDLLDTAAARVKINLEVEPAELESLHRQIESLEREKLALCRDEQQGHMIDANRIQVINDLIATHQQDHAHVTSKWQEQKEIALDLLAKRTRLSALQESSTKDESAALDVLRQEIQQQKRIFEQLHKTQPFVFTEVTPDTVAQVVSDWTGVPLGKMQRDSAEQMLGLVTRLQERIHGQSQGLAHISSTLKAAQAGLRDPSQPLGVFLLAGPSGVGKTETALAVADELFGGEGAVTVINMSEFQDKHTISRLIGSPPGYVGYGEGGVLTEAVRQRPYSVVLLDEVEKGHLDVLNLFYQVFDKGVLADGEGRIIDFSNTVIFLTSNLGTDEITALTQQAQPTLDQVVEHIRPLLSRHFKPALLARMNVVPYYALSAEALQGIVQRKLQRLSHHFYQANRIPLFFDEAVVAMIAARCTEVETGARNVDLILRKSILPLLAEQVLASYDLTNSPIKAWHVGLNEQQQWVINAQETDNESV